MLNIGRHGLNKDIEMPLFGANFKIERILGNQETVDLLNIVEKWTNVQFTNRI